MKNSLFQTIFLGIFGVGALIGLFVFATYTGKNDSGAEAVGTVVIWGTLPAADIQSALGTISQTDQSLKGVSYVQKDSATLQSSLATAIATGEAPDLILASQEDFRTLAKFITTIPFSALPANTFSSVFIDESKILVAPDGTGYYGIPFLVDPLVLFSNRSILANSGIAKPPATWESLIGLVPNIAVLTPSRQVTRGLIALGTYTNVHNARGILSALFLQQDIPISSYTTNGILSASFNDDVSGRASRSTAALGFYAQFADPAKVSYTWNPSLPDSEQMFYSGDLALYLGYASRARFLAAANPHLNFVVTPFPQSATAKVKSTYGLLYSFMIPRGAKNPSGAYQAAVLFAGSSAQIASAESTGLAPATLDELAKAPPKNPVAAVAYSSALYSKGWLSPSAVATDQVFSGMIENVISGRLSLEVALAQTASSLSALLQQ